MHYIYSGDLTKALSSFKLAGSDKLLDADPFVIHIRDCHDCDAKPPYKTYTKVSFVERMQSLSRIAQGNDQAAANASLEMANGVLSISGEKKSETEDKDRRFSERYYGRFERRIPLEDVDEGKAQASFKNGILTVTIPKSGEAKQNVRRIPINQST